VTTETGHPAAPDLARYIQPGDLVAWGQGCAEPLTLTEALADQRKQLGGVRCFTGISSPAAVRPEHCDYLSFSSYTAAGVNRALSEAGLLDIVPCHYSRLPDILSRGPLRVDVLFLALPPPGPDGTFGLGLGADYLAPLVGRARTVIAEVNDQVPDVRGDRRLSRAEIDVLVHTSRPPAEHPGRPATAACAG
jgi:acyl-CoA hydrolase